MNNFSRIYRYVALIMAFLMFFTSSGLSIDRHYCQGHLKSFSFFGKAKSCYQLADAESNLQCTANKNNKITEKANSCSLMQKDCCKNKLLQIISDQDKKIQSNQLLITQQLQTFVVAFVSVFLSSPAYDTVSANHISYKPPLIPKDIHVLLETYLL